MQKNLNRYFPISLYKVQVQMDQRPPHKTRYTETIRRENGENSASDRGLVSNINKELRKLYYKELNNPILKQWHTELTKNSLLGNI